MLTIPISLYLFALILLLLVPNSLQQPRSLPNSVTTAMASREMRYHHFLWHSIRNNWNALSSNSQEQIAALGWRPPRPAKDSSGRSLKDNNSGEDFLYMHRQMITLVNKLLDRAGAPRVSGFKTIPAANDRNYPMPPDYDAPAGLNNLVTYYKSNTYYQSMKKVEARCKDRNFLRSMTLGQFGSYLEWTSDIHQGMHFRYSSYNRLMRPKSAPTIPYIDPKWDVKSANWLADIYSSQVNPWFWKLHGWIDDRINDWAKANGVTTIRWKGKWLGGNMQDLPYTLEIPDNPDVNFGGSSSGTSGSNTNVQITVQSANSEEEMDMGTPPDPNIGILEDDVDPSMSMTMDVSTMEQISKIMISEGLACDFYSDLGTVTVPDGPPAGPGNW